MARNNTIKALRTTRANLNSQAGANNLLQGEPYLITDENRLAIGLGVSSYQDFMKAGEALASTQLPAFSGDVSSSSGSSVLTLAGVNNTAGSFGSGTAIPVLTVNGKGLVTSASSVALSTFTSTTSGVVPASGGGTTNYLRADGTWATPAGGSSTRLSNLTFNNSNAGDASGASYSGAAAVTVSANTIGAATSSNAALTGTPTAPTPTSDSNGTVLATTAFSQSLQGTVAKSITGGAVQLTAAEAASNVIIVVGTLTSNAVLSLGSASGTPFFARSYVVVNATSGSFTLSVQSTSSGATNSLTVAQGTNSHLFTTGSNVYLSDNDPNNKPLFSSAARGMAPASGGGTANYLRSDGTWTPPVLSTSQSFLDLNNTAPGLPASGSARIFRADVGGREMIRVVGDDGDFATIQPHMGRNNPHQFIPAFGSTTPTIVGFPTWTTLATATARTWDATSRYTRTRRIGYVSAATAGTSTGIYNTSYSCSTGDTSSGGGGFHMIVRFGIADTLTGSRMFIGLSNSVAAPATSDLTSLTQHIGVGKLSGSSNLCVYGAGTTAQSATDLGTGYPAATSATDLYEFIMFSPSSTTPVTWMLTRFLSSGTSTFTSGTFGTAGTAAPAATIGLGPRCWRQTATAASAAFDIAGIYLETDI